MAKAIYQGVSGVARKVKQPLRGVNGVSRKVKNVWRGVGGVARQCFSGVQMVTITIDGQGANTTYAGLSKVIINGTEYTSAHDAVVTVPAGTVVTCVAGYGLQEAIIYLNNAVVARGNTEQRYNYTVNRDIEIELKLYTQDVSLPGGTATWKGGRIYIYDR